MGVMRRQGLARSGREFGLSYAGGWESEVLAQHSGIVRAVLQEYYSAATRLSIIKQDRQLTRASTICGHGKGSSEGKMGMTLQNGFCMTQ